MYTKLTLEKVPWYISFLTSLTGDKGINQEILCYLQKW